MRKILCWIFVLALVSCNSTGKRDLRSSILSRDPGNKMEFIQWALSPPMGWNSFDAFDCRINEGQFREQVDFMAENLLQFGWNYAVIDYIWWHPDPGNWKNPKRRYGHPDIRYDSDGKPLDSTTIDEFGRLMPAVNRFPSASEGNGFRIIADYVHSKGMKFGIHIMRGAHRYAYYYDLPVMGTKYTFRDIVLKSDTCNWCNHMYGVDPSKPGSQEYYNSLFELYASWGIDFVKVDDILSPVYHKGEIELIRNAIENCGRPIVLSLSPGEAPPGMSEHLASEANMWRISADFWDDWEKILHNFDLLHSWEKNIKPGTWPDADMLPIGRLSVGGRPHGPERFSNLTWQEHYTLMSLWIISRSPLIIGGDLPGSPDSTLFFLTNPEVLRVNQRSTGNMQLLKNNAEVIWVADDPESGVKYLAVFNLTESDRSISIQLDTIVRGGSANVRDLWQRRDLGFFSSDFKTVIPPHGAGLYKLGI